MTNADVVMELVWAQAWQLSVLIVSVWFTTRWVAKDRPHLAHTLWVVVLLKCITPPIWSSPAGVLSRLQWQTPATAERPLPKSSTANDLRCDPKIELRATATRTPETAVSLQRDAHVHVLSSAAPRVNSSASYIGRLIPFDGSSLVVLIWISGALIVFLVVVVRFGVFVARFPCNSADEDREINACVRRLAHRLAVRRNVRVVISDHWIGPAVFGLLHPTILLPSVIIREKSTEELEPLIAHELIHVRRGDLLWAAVQTLATCLWWFHPLVWVASRMITREAERSCDEEVVAGLGCAPELYARGLLDVLELKHRLHSAPSSPGVRAVDVTSSRLERIMKLGQGSHRRMPWWCWLTLAASLPAVLPGAPVAEADPADSSPIISAELDNSQDDAVAGRNKPVDAYSTRMYAVGDLVAADLSSFTNLQWTVPKGQVEKAEANVSLLAEMVVRNVAVDSWDRVGGSGALNSFVNTGMLVVSQTQPVHVELGNWLNDLRDQVGLAKMNYQAEDEQRRVQNENGEMISRIYPVADLVVPLTKPLSLSEPAATAGLRVDFDSLRELITCTVAPGSWIGTGGKGSIVFIRDQLAIQVTQTANVQAQVDRHLRRLRSLQDVQIEVRVHLVRVPEEALRQLENLQGVGGKQSDDDIARLAIVSPRKVRYLLAFARAAKNPSAVHVPPITLFNGQTCGIGITKDGQWEEGEALQLQPMVTEDNKAIALRGWTGGEPFRAEEAVEGHRVPEGHTLMVDISERSAELRSGRGGTRLLQLLDGDKAASGQRVMLLVTPHLVSS